MNKPLDIELGAENSDLQGVLTRARRLMTPEQVIRLDNHLKKLMDRLSTEDGNPRAFTPHVPRVCNE